MGKVITLKYGKESTRDIVIPESGELNLSEDVMDILMVDHSYDDQLPEGLVATLKAKRAAAKAEPHEPKKAMPDEKKEDADDEKAMKHKHKKGNW